MRPSRKRAIAALIAAAGLSVLLWSSAELRAASAHHSAHDAPVGAAVGPSALKPFSGKVSRLNPRTRKRMRGTSWHRGCPVPLRKLRSVDVSYVDFHKRARRGRLITHHDHAKPMLRVFSQLYAKRFRIRRIEPIKAYGGDDHRSMAADNTSAFNCRYVAGTTRWSRHAYGKAIDINPRENPYVTPSGHVSPPEGRPYVDRDDVRTGMIVRRGPVVRSFRRIAGWKWGGDWSGTKDYQHFSDNGR